MVAYGIGFRDHKECIRIQIDNSKLSKQKKFLIEEILSNARLINESELDTSKVLVHSKVEVKNKTNGALMKYKLVAQSEADLKTGKISVDSPIGKGLLGKTEGEVAEIIVPNGTIEFEIVSISRD